MPSAFVEDATASVYTTNRHSSNWCGGHRFEAAWVGDLEKIKSLTLHAWGGEDKAEPPLKIAVEDSDENTLFSLA